VYGTGVDPSTVTHAFTLADPTLAWLILNGIKRIENRNFAMRPGWYAVHVSQKARVTKEREASLRGEHMQRCRRRRRCGVGVYTGYATYAV
jgi:hypothetical protein